MIYDDKSFALINAFVEFVKDPKKFSDIANDLKTQSASNQASLKDLVGAKDIQKFYDDSMAAIDKAKKDLADAQASFDESTKKQTSALADKSSALSNRETAVGNRESAVVVNEARINSASKALDAKQTDVDSSIAKLNALKQELASREAALADKADKIRELVG